MVPPRSDRVSRAPPYSRMHRSLHLRGYHPLRPAFPDHSTYPPYTTGLFHFRSPLLAESRLMSVPPGTEMFQFPGFASWPYVFKPRYPKGVGCPIRTSTDQSLLAAPHGFSQRATSFIASWCQGIHRMPFSCSTHRRQSSVVRPHIRRQTSDVRHQIRLRQQRRGRRLHSLSTLHNAPEPCRHRPRDDPWPGLRRTTIPSGQTNHRQQQRTNPRLQPAA